MKRIRWTHALLAAGTLAGFAACKDALAPILDQDLAEDIAASAGDAIAADVAEAIANEVTSGFAPPSDIAASPADDSVRNTFNASRTRTCYNAGGTVVTCGAGTTSMKIVLTIDGSRTGPNWSGALHRARTDSIHGLGTNTRVHNARGTSNDTTSFTRDSSTRRFAEASIDSVINLTFQLPRSSSPWPTAGQIIRNVTATITITGRINESRSISRRVVVTFPADAQGNVPLQVGTMTCQLNLVTHRVTGCTGG
jgi:hypothetical protein